MITSRKKGLREVHFPGKKDNEACDYMSAFVQYGVSEELIGVLTAIAEMTDGEGERVFKPKDVQKFNQMILCRQHRQPLWILSNLLAVVAATQSEGRIPPIERFFWLEENYTAARFIAAFEKPFDVNGVRTEMNAELKIVYEDGSFGLAPNYVPVLVALLQLVIQDMGNVLFKKVRELEDSPTKKSINAFASILQSSMDEYLKKHLKPEQQANKGREILTWLADSAGGDGNEPPAPDISDESVLAFWLDSIEKGRDDFKLFNSVADGFQALAWILKEGDVSVAMQRAASFGMDDEGVSINPETYEAKDTSHHQGEYGPDLNLLDRLQEGALSRIKFITDKDATALKHLVNNFHCPISLAITLLRREHFGQEQVMIGQSLRAKNEEAALLHAKCDGVPLYDVYVAERLEQVPKLEATIDASTHVLVQLKHPSAAAILIRQLSEESLVKLATILEIDEEAVSINAVNAELGDVYAEDADSHIDSQEFMNRLSSLLLQLPELNAIVDRCRSAYKRINRRGFQDIPEGLDGKAYADGVEILQELLSAIDICLQEIASKVESKEHYQELYASDHAIFKRVFNELYVLRLMEKHNEH